jgi:hypothetical protein
MPAAQVLTDISKFLTIALQSTLLPLSSLILPGQRQFLPDSALYRVQKEVRYADNYPDSDGPIDYSRHSQDTVRDVRGFAVKFYTEEGNWDIVGNDIPVFFIQDAVKFPDIIHAVKPEPHNEVPQGQTAHNNFWDFVGLQPESKFHIYLLRRCFWPKLE